MISRVGLASTQRIRNRWSHKPWFVALALAASFLAARTSHAATYTWWATGSSGSVGGTGTWDTSALRWTTDGSTWSAWNNASIDTAVFGGASAGSVTLSTGITVGGLTFDTTGYTITGNTLTLGNTSGTTAVTVNANAATVESILAGSNRLRKLGTGALTLSGTSTFTGGGMVSAGTLVLLGSNVVSGTTSGAWTVNGGTLDLRGGMGLFKTGSFFGASNTTYVTVSSGTLISDKFSSGDNNNFNQLRNNYYSISLDGGALMFTGTQNFSRAFQVGSNGGTIVVPAGADVQKNVGTTGAQTIIRFTADSTLTLDVDGEFRLNDTLAPASYGNTGFSLVKTGTGTVKLGLGGANNYTGTTTVNAGTLVASNTAAFGAPSGTIVVSGGILNLGTFNITRTGTISFRGGTVQSGTFTNNTVAYDAQAGTVLAVLAGSAGLSKTTSGTLTLSGNNTYSGNTVVDAGTVVAGINVAFNGGNAPAFGTGDITVNNALITSSTTFAVTGGQNTTRTLTLNSGTWNLTFPAAEYVRTLILTSGLVTTSNTSSFRAANGGLSISTLASSGTSVITPGFDLTLSSLTLDVADGTATTDLAINGAITENTGAGSGAKSITKSGAGTVLLAASNSYSGGTVINAGTVVSGTGVAFNGGNAPAFGTGDITVNNALITGTTARSVGGGNNTTRTLALNSGTWNIDYAGTGGEYIRSLTLSSGLVTTSNTSWFRAPNGGLSISTLASSGTSVIGSRFDLTYSNLTLDVADGTATVDLALNGAITENTDVAGGAKSITKSGAGTVLLSASNSYSGGTVINAGIVSFAANALGSSGTITIKGGTLQWATGNTKDISSRLALVSGSTATLDTNTNNVTLATGFGGSTSASLVKSGLGTLTLSGSNGFTGSTAVDAGVLAVNGSLANASLTVASGATLMGSGTIAGLTTIAGMHRPGNSPGVETFTNLTYNTGASVQWELWNNTASNSPIAYDQIVVNGDLAFSGPTMLDLVFTGSASASNFSSVAWANPFWDSSREWMLYEVAGTLTTANNLTLNVTNWQDSTGAYFQTARPNSTFSVEQRANDIYIVYAAVPEPTTAALAVMGLAAVVVLRRRKRLGGVS